MSGRSLCDRIFQILALVADNASNNNTLVEELEFLLTSYRGSVTRVPCFAHILNLVVKVKSLLALD